MNLQSNTGEAEASGSQANNHRHHQHRARMEEHDYIGMSDQHQQQQHQRQHQHQHQPQHQQQKQQQQQQQQTQTQQGLTPKSTAPNKSSGKELNMRRTELQLGLPGSPVDGGEEEDDTTAPFSASMQLKKKKISSSVDKDKDKDGANARGGVGSSSSSSSCHLIKQHPRIVDETPDCVEKQETRAPVGWPPVQSFRKNSLNAPANNTNSNTTNTNANNNNTNNSDKHSENTTTSANPGGPSNPGGAATVAPAPPPTTATTTTITATSQLVKVYMDGVPIGRKVNLRTHSSYDRLSAALEEMFKRFISGQQSGGNKAMKEKVASECKKFNFIYGSDYVLTYEDKDGDLMLVGDVPWVMFVGTVKRLRIMKGSEAIGLAPRDQQPAAAPAGNAK